MNINKETKNFKFRDFIKSDTAKSLNIDNTPKDEVIVNNINNVMDTIQHIRTKFGNGIIIESGYRCDKLNKAVRGSSTSAHLYGLAIDFYPLDRSLMKKLQDLCIKMVENKEILIDQLIIEKPKNNIASWLHLGIERPKTKEKRQQIFTIK